MITKYIFVSDIFGHTENLEELVESLPFNSIIIDPYDGKRMMFEGEQKAYQYFTKHVGLNNYTEKLHQVLTAMNAYIYLIGFSVGASVIWRVSERGYANNIRNAFIFYGSQIRHYVDIEPKFKINVVCPAQESHFDINALISLIKEKQQVVINRSNYYHGFMNRCSTNFDEEGYRQHMQLLAQHLR